MQRTSDHIWISFGVGDEHTLHPATVCGMDVNGAPLCRFDIAPKPGLLFPDPPRPIEAIFYYQSTGGFIQQPAIIDCVETGSGPGVRVEPIGIAAIAEDRIAERFRVAPLEFTAVLAGDDVCPVIDVSPRGICVHSDRDYEMGQIINLAFESPDARVVRSGYCRIRSMKTAGKRRRFGMLVQGEPEGGTLHEGLREVIDWVRREQASQMPQAG